MPDSGANKTATGRSLPSWMSSKLDVNKSDKRKPGNVGAKKEKELDEGETHDHAKRRGKAHTNQTHSEENENSQSHSQENASKTKSSASNLGATKFSKLLDGVIFVLSGFVNPERTVLRSQALEMGAQYQADWNADCTLLVCAFPNTPKFRQVEADSGTIVSKEWITECFNQKKLVDIETYLMNAGKPWRRQCISVGAEQDEELSASKKSEKRVERAAHSKPTTSAASKRAYSTAKGGFSPSKVKKWAIDDLERTQSWLESQEEKPDPSEIKKIAAEGILICLQDAIDSLKQEQDIKQITEQWNFVPRVVEELAKLEGNGDASASLPKKDLYRRAMACKQVYEAELGNLDEDSAGKKKKPKTEENERDHYGRTKFAASEASDYDSDETIEMTEDEISHAYDTVAISIVNAK